MRPGRMQIHQHHAVDRSSHCAHTAYGSGRSYAASSIYEWVTSCPASPAELSPTLVAEMPVRRSSPLHAQTCLCSIWTGTRGRTENFDRFADPDTVTRINKARKATHARMLLVHHCGQHPHAIQSFHNTAGISLPPDLANTAT